MIAQNAVIKLEEMSIRKRGGQQIGMDRGGQQIGMDI